MINPLLITLTGDDQGQLAGRKKKKPVFSKKVKRAAKIAAIIAAPVPVLATLAIRKKMRKDKARKKAKAAQARKTELERKKKTATTAAAINPTPGNQAAAQTATIQAAAATAAANTAATEEQEAEQESTTPGPSSLPSNQETSDQETSDQETSDQETSDQETSDQDTGETSGIDPLYINANELQTRNFLGFAELTTNEQIAKKIYEATGDRTFKGFLPYSWNTAQIVKMQDAAQRLKAAGKLTAVNMMYQIPSVSQAAHQYFLTNADKIKGIFPENWTPGDLAKPFNPLFIAAGLVAVAVIVSQVVPMIPKGKK